MPCFTYSLQSLLCNVILCYAMYCQVISSVVTSQITIIHSNKVAMLNESNDGDDEDDRTHHPNIPELGF